jgi:hypothetical protein
MVRESKHLHTETYFWKPLAIRSPPLQRHRRPGLMATDTRMNVDPQSPRWRVLTVPVAGTTNYNSKGLKFRRGMLYIFTDVVLEGIYTASLI